LNKQRLRIFIGAMIIGLASSLVVSCSTSEQPESTSTLSLPKATISPTHTATQPVDVPMKMIDLTTVDGVPLKARYYPAKQAASVATTIVLLHGAYEDSRSWNGFRAATQDAGYAVLTLDLRGHGQSGGEKLFDSSMDHDIDAALAWLNTSPDVGVGSIAMAGESLGANLALRAGARHPEIKSLILLSPGMLLWEIDIAEAIIGYGSRPLLLVAAEEDGYPASTVQTLNDQALGYHKLQIYPGAEHGTKMIGAHPELTTLMLDWLQETLP
jgi:pimeloyl-ACP methyl ester carboxylesterase